MNHSPLQSLLSESESFIAGPPANLRVSRTDSIIPEMSSRKQTLLNSLRTHNNFRRTIRPIQHVPLAEVSIGPFS
jgi:hypothetical protein